MHSHELTGAPAGGGSGGLLDRDRVLALLHEYTEGPGLRKHAYGVEAAMRAYAARHGEDESLWGAAGLLHDMDYEKHPTPEEHPRVGCRALEERGYPAALIEAIMGHASYTGVPRASRMAKALFAVDELVGLITATALVMPSRRLADVTTESVIKKMRTKGFARSVNRDEIEQGAAELGVPLEEHVTFVLTAMQGAADRLGL
ncbi:MAG TPA: HDIG domain-containing protein [Candidatus Eisenbacteria bacterium]|nr:HDIG domain-containing protein [Candidatus Eisenbacteria bacterium]